MYRDEVVLWLFRTEREKCMEHQIDMVQSALEDIRREIQSLHEAITLDKI